jgi:hypothetical protein
MVEVRLESRMPEETKSRRQVVKAAALGALALALPTMSESQSQTQASTQAPPKPPPLPADLVKEFVIAAHHDLPRVQEMLTAEPRLLNACWDWGGGDFETGLEGAGHMGNKEIARYLISKGARMNVFQAAMLGHLDLVKGIVAAHPETARSKGPHGISLIAHAKAGGDDAKEVLEYLQKLE